MSTRDSRTIVTSSLQENTVRIAKGSVSATEMAKLGKCDLLISETPERLFGRQGEGNKQEKARGDELHAKYEKRSKDYRRSQ